MRPSKKLHEIVENGMSSIIQGLTDVPSALHATSQGVEGVRRSFEGRLFADDEPLDEYSDAIGE